MVLGGFAHQEFLEKKKFEAAKDGSLFSGRTKTSDIQPELQWDGIRLCFQKAFSKSNLNQWQDLKVCVLHPS